MPDLSEVTQALGELIGATLYPAGASGENASPITSCPVLVQEGWPDPKSLEAASKGTKVLVSIYPLPGERITTRYPERREENPIPAVTYGLAVAGQVITVSGAAPTPYVAQNLAVWINGGFYVAQAAASQTPAQVAAALAAAIGADYGGLVVAGATITIPTGLRIGDLVVGTTGSVQREVRRQERQFQITTWAGTPALRSTVAKAIDAALAQVRFLGFADGTGGRLQYRGSPVTDFDQRQGVYRRDLIYTVEYGTIIVEAAAQIVVSVADAFGPFGQPLTGLGGLDFSDPTNSGLLPLV